jgi:hypothetical protein
MTALKRFLFISIFALLPVISHAQMEASITLTPPNPSPYQAVVLTLSSYSFDINVSNIIWSSSGKTLLSGFGEKKLTVTMGDVGQVLPISYKATLADGTFVQGSISLSPQSVDLVYEAKESYVPPFYEGRALPGEGSVVRVTAIPTIAEGGAKLAPTSLSYSWYVNGEYSDRASGAGKSTANIALDYLSNSTEVKVLVRSPRGNAAEASVSIYPKETLPTLYKYDEVLGVDFSRAFSRRLELDGDTTLSLQPYYLSARAGLEPTAVYDWYLDGLPVTPQEQTLLALRPKDNAYGVRTLSIVMENTKRQLQKARAELEVVFDTRK